MTSSTSARVQPTNQTVLDQVLTDALNAVRLDNPAFTFQEMEALLVRQAELSRLAAELHSLEFSLLNQKLGETEAQADKLRDQLTAIQRSTWWLAGTPVRKFLDTVKGPFAR